MSQPRRDDAAPPTSAEPTMRVQPPPRPGRAVRAQLAAGELATPPVRQDEPTVTLGGPESGGPRHTLEFDGPPTSGVTVGAKPRRPRRTWPWILAVVLALLVLGAVLLVMLWRGASISQDIDLVGGPLPVAGDLVGGSGGTTLR
jgi:hypothetical protein